MNVPVSRLPSKIIVDLKTIGQEASRQGMKAYLVGGVVRDILLQRTNADFDIVIEGDALAVARALALRHQAELTIYPQFSTATLEFVNGVVMDFATARQETYRHPGALPVVKAGGIEDDLYRRDFTINALAISLGPDSFGTLVDAGEGLRDLKAKRIRIWHDLSFIDDPTRILRAVRFAVRLGFNLEIKTLALLKSAIANQAPAAVKPPRYFAEFRKVFEEKSPWAVLKKLHDLKALYFIHPGYSPDGTLLKRIEKWISRYKKDPFYSGVDFSWIYVLGVFASLPLSFRKVCEQQFQLTKEERLSLKDLANVVELETQLKQKSLKSSRIYEILDPVSVEIIYFILVATSANIVRRRVDQFLKIFRKVELKINGDDLKGLGVAPGRMMGAVLHTILMWKIDGKLKTHQEELNLAKQFLSQGLRME